MGAQHTRTIRPTERGAEALTHPRRPVILPVATMTIRHRGKSEAKLGPHGTRPAIQVYPENQDSDGVTVGPSLLWGGV